MEKNKSPSSLSSLVFSCIDVVGSVMKAWLLAANIALFVGFILFAVLHVAWLIYIWRFDSKWKFAQAMQNECGDNTFELDTVRWNMNKTILNDRTVKSLITFTNVLLVLYPIVVISSIIIIVLIVRKTVSPLTTGLSKLFEYMQGVPASAYYSLIAVCLLGVTVLKTSKYYGRNPRYNKLSGLMKPYRDSLVNVENTMALIKSRAPRTSTQFDREQGLKEKIARRIVMVQNAESEQMGAAIMELMTPKEMIGYLQFKEDMMGTALCRYVKEDYMKFTNEEKAAFVSAMTTNNPMPMLGNVSSASNTAITNIKTKIVTTDNQKKYPYLYQYFDALKLYYDATTPDTATVSANTIADFVDTWWEPTIENGITKYRTLRALNDDGVWDNTITPKICQSWKNTWDWDSTLADIKKYDPSSKLKPMVRDLKIYFAITFIFVAAILYTYVPKGVVLPIAFASLLLVFLFAYLTQYM